jgi:NagD protein
MNNNKENIDSIKLFALDMDGTIYLGTKWIDGARKFLDAVENSGRRYVFLTNNSSKDPASYLEKLANMGLNITRDKIITSVDATIHMLQKEYPGKRVYLLGNDLLKRQFRESGIILVNDELEEEYKRNGCLSGSSADLVVVGFDTSLDYLKMSVVCDLVRSGLPYITTHPDYNCPTETGFIPDAGAIHAFIEASAGRRPDITVGKPNAGIIDYMVDITQTGRSEIAMVGDRLYTDVAAGVNNGLTGILVLSGEATMEDVATSNVKPDMIFDSVKDMIALL